MTAAEFRLPRPVVLVGLMGAGKSTVGARLAERLGVPFADSDSEIETAAGLSVAEIFEKDGEAAFRAMERDAIAKLIAGPPQVIAAGGGTFADQESRRAMLERCIVVWLDADVSTLAGRLASAANRPLLRGVEPEAILRRLAAARETFHAQAPVRVDARAPVDQVVETIAAALAACD